ncbi:MAG TPA: cytochrome c3 family protein [Candidatus Hydrogenedentes bacterium]|nr:cytochrome c3 family protein [Candidatus Hydrogenedentota bacterium]HNT87313.1 cytochrome c3 family protein [Candidatus Hydrogenedentota bacterium]
MSRRNAERYLVLGTLLLCFVVACASFTKGAGTRRDRGLRFPHATHADDLGCTDCHDMSRPEGLIPDHETCSTCHDIDTDNPTPEQCGMCHTREDYALDARSSVLPAGEIKFSHDPHVAAGLECGVCHEDPDQRILPKKATKAFCMDCHQATDPKLNECQVCHETLNKDVRPLYRFGSRIQHDAPAIWEHLHGKEARIDPAYCALCHDTPASCEECHRSNPPRNHTVSWRRKGHGFHATVDRSKCVVCHEEDSCIECHENTQPASHRGGWGHPMNRHCVSCHFPPERSNCTVCHESVEHRGAMPSPHNFGLYPGACGLCHPGGVPYLAPHPLNSTARCTACH